MVEGGQRHPVKALTAVKVRSLKEPGRYGDGNGLYLVVDPSGAKRWVLRTVVQGRRRDIGLGGTRVVSLSQARDEAARLRMIARQGEDPLIERRERRQKVPTFEQAAREVHKSHAATFRNRKHVGQWIGTLEKSIFPVFGSLRVDQIQSADVLRALSPIWLTTPETARRVRQRIQTVFDWAKAKNFCSGDNPVEGTIEALRKHRKKDNHFKSLQYTKVPDFIQELRKVPSGVSVRLAFEFLILTATRTSEVLLAKWDEVDLKATSWTIPAGRMKGDREHRVPLAPRCVEILEAAMKITDGGPYVFSGRSAGRPLSNMAFHMVLRRMDRTDCTPHGFRSSFRVWSAERTNFPREVCEAALAHTLKDKVEAAYRRTDLFELRRKLMNTWSAFVTSEKARVVQIRTGRKR